MLVLSNPKICTFYESHPSLHVEDMNLFFIDILEKLLQDAQPSLNHSLATKLIEQMNGLQTTMTKTQHEQQTQHWMKMAEMKRDYMEDLKLILSHNNVEKISPLLLHSTQLLEGKLKEWIPSAQEGKWKEFQLEFQKDTTKLLQNSINKDTLEEFIANIDGRFAKTMVTSQTFMHNLVSSSEQRLQHKIEAQENNVRELKEISQGNKQAQSTLQSNVTDLLKKIENSSHKGKLSENLLMGILQNLYPSAQIDFVGNAKEMGDFIMYRQNKPTVLFENKNYDKNVVQEEVKKFLRDVESQDCCGVMIAQHYGIAHKENYEIDVHNGNVLVYVHKAEYDPEKIKIAVDLIDHFKSTLTELDYDSETVQLDKYALETINKEYQQFVLHKLNQTKCIKEYTTKLLAQMDEFKLPLLEQFLAKHFATSLSKENTCPYCQYAAKNGRALTAHFRGCAQKKGVDKV